MITLNKRLQINASVWQYLDFLNKCHSKHILYPLQYKYVEFFCHQLLRDIKTY